MDFLTASSMTAFINRNGGMDDDKRCISVEPDEIARYFRTDIKNVLVLMDECRIKPKQRIIADEVEDGFEDEVEEQAQPEPTAAEPAPQPEDNKPGRPTVKGIDLLTQEARKDIAHLYGEGVSSSAIAKMIMNPNTGKPLTVNMVLDVLREDGVEIRGKGGIRGKNPHITAHYDPHAPTHAPAKPVEDNPTHKAVEPVPAPHNHLIHCNEPVDEDKTFEGMMADLRSHCEAQLEPLQDEESDLAHKLAQLRLRISLYKDRIAKLDDIIGDANVS